MELDAGEPRRRALRVFDHQKKLIAIAEAVVPRTYQPIVVFEPCLDLSLRRSLLL